MSNSQSPKLPDLKPGVVMQYNFDGKGVHPGMVFRAIQENGGYTVFLVMISHSLSFDEDDPNSWMIEPDKVEASGLIVSEKRMAFQLNVIAETRWEAASFRPRTNHTAREIFYGVMPDPPFSTARDYAASRWNQQNPG